MQIGWVPTHFAPGDRGGTGLKCFGSLGCTVLGAGTTHHVFHKKSLQTEAQVEDVQKTPTEMICTVHKEMDG